MKTNFRKKVSLVLVLTMLAQLMCAGGIMTASAAATVAVVENGADYFAAAKAYGVYTETAGETDGSDIKQGLEVLPAIPANTIAHVDDTATLEYIDAAMFPDLYISGLQTTKSQLPIPMLPLLSNILIMEQVTSVCAM